MRGLDRKHVVDGGAERVIRGQAEEQAFRGAGEHTQAFRGDWAAGQGGGGRAEMQLRSEGQ